MVNPSDPCLIMVPHPAANDVSSLPLLLFDTIYYNIATGSYLSLIGLQMFQYKSVTHNQELILMSIYSHLNWFPCELILPVIPKMRFLITGWYQFLHKQLIKYSTNYSLILTVIRSLFEIIFNAKARNPLYYEIFIL